MEYQLTKEEIPHLKGDELLNYLWDVELDIHAIEFSITHDRLVEGSEMYDFTVRELKELRELHEALMDEVVIRKMRE
jgi:hypothetical protein